MEGSKNIKRKCSYRKNIKRRETCFKKGNKLSSERQKVHHEECIASVSFAETSKQNSLPENVPKQRSRLPKSLALDVLYASSDSSGTVPFRLRPSSATEKREINTDKHTEENSFNAENVIVNLKMLENAFKCMKGHACENEDLRLSVLDRKGLCITIKIKCMNCGFNSVDVPLFQSVKRHGRSTGVINDCLLLPVLSSKLGISDLQRVLACLNIQSIVVSNS